MYELSFDLLKGRFPFMLMMTETEIRELMIRVLQASRITNLEMEEILARISKEMETSLAHA